MTVRALTAGAAVILSLACAKPAADDTAPAPQATAAAPAGDVVLFVGDSLTAGYGVALEEAYPALVEERWKGRGLKAVARNAGVSGATSAGVLENIAWSLTPDVAAVVVAVGANDGLRGLDLARMEENIDAVLARVQASGARAVLAGMKLPPNYGADYAARFAEVYPRLARRRGVPLIPFLLEGVAGLKEMNQPDGIHPNAAGHRRIADTVDAALAKAGLP
ncbi:MAG: arylesterase [Elusimicrobia bacterium]|nr:arylesterase [Elusimicrobiota bacterium]